MLDLLILFPIYKLYTSSMVALEDSTATVLSVDENFRREAALGNVEKVEQLHALGADLEASGIDHLTALMLAVQKGNAQIVRLLLKLGADVNVFDTNGYSVLAMAVVRKDAALVRDLCAAGACLEAITPQGQTALHIAAVRGCPQTVHVLLAAGANESATIPPIGATALHAAAAHLHLEAVRVLVAAGASLSARTAGGRTPLHSAVCNPMATVFFVRSLVELGADISMQDYNGYSSLSLAATFGTVSTVETLLDLGADINSQSQKGHSTMHAAAASSRVDIIKCLRLHGGDIAASTVAGSTPVHAAASHGAVAAVQYFIDAGVDVFHLDHRHDFRADVLSLLRAVRSESSQFPGMRMEQFRLHSIIKLVGHYHCLSNSSSDKGVEVFKRAVEQAVTRACVPAGGACAALGVSEFCRLGFRARCQIMQLSSLTYSRRVAAIPEGEEPGLVVDLVCLFFRPDVLKDVLSLRRVCRRCEAERRFPVTHVGASVPVLEVHLIEGFIGGDISYYVPTADLHAAVGVYAATALHSLN